MDVRHLDDWSAPVSDKTSERAAYAASPVLHRGRKKRGTAQTRITLLGHAYKAGVHFNRREGAADNSTHGAVGSRWGGGTRKRVAGRRRVIQRSRWRRRTI